MNSIFITGASSGIGLAAALKFAESGWVVYAGTRDPERDRLKFSSYKNLLFTYVDVTDENTIRQAMRDIAQGHTRLDVLFCNAGAGMLKALGQAELTEIRELFDLNVYGVMRTVKEALPLLQRSENGHIIVTSSTAGVTGQALNEIYCATKFAVEGLMESLAVYYKPFFNIDVTLLEPGAVNSSFSQKLMDKISSEGGFPEDEYLPVLDAFMKNFGAANNAPQTPESVAEILFGLTEMKEKPLRLRTSEAAELFTAGKIGHDPTGLQALAETRHTQLGR